jgi:hypothetical protein
MNSKILKSVLVMIVLMIFSCDEPETIVTEIIRTDGSVYRKVEMKNKKKDFDPAKLRVPVDSTWSFKDTVVIALKDGKSDTTWIRTAEKNFSNVDEINKEYSSDRGCNKASKRNVSFNRKFKWFNTEFRFSENLEKCLKYGYPIKNYLNKEQLDFFYLPTGISEEKLSGPDSTKFKASNDTIEKKAETWLWSSLISEWIEEFSLLTAGRTGEEISRENLKKMEEKAVEMIKSKSPESDSAVIKEFLGKANYEKFKKDIDRTTSMITKRVEGWSSFKEYSLRLAMPGKVISTNGYIDKNGELLWPVKSDYFLSERYEMWAVSKISNTWAWIVSGIFLLFVVSGLVFRIIKK